MENYRIDLHCDLYTHFDLKTKNKEENIFKKYHLDNFKKGNVLLSVANIWVDEVLYPDVSQKAKEIMVNSSNEYYQNNDVLNLVLKYDDITYDGRINLLIGLEGLNYLEKATDIYFMYQYGARLASLTWNNSNIFAASITNDNDYGLTDEGVKLIKIMNELKMIIDISHLSDKAAVDILKLSNQPVIASHSNSRTICNHRRNISDEIALMIKEKGGVVGLNSYPVFVSSDDNKKNVEGLVDHLDYFKKLIGIDHVSFGFDFMDFFDNDDLDGFIEGDSFMSDLKNQSYLDNLINSMKNRGYTDEEIEKVSYKNALRIIKNILG